MSAPTPDPIRAELLRILTMTNPREELAAWRTGHGTTTGVVEEFYSIAAAYVLGRRFDLEAITKGYSKSGAAVVAFVESLKARVPGPPDPETYFLPGDRIAVYLWRTEHGPKLVAFQRAEPAESGSCPDQWRQVNVLELGQDSRAVMLGDVTRWEIPDRPFKGDPPPDTSFEHRVAVRCGVTGCEAESAVECGHETVEEQAGFRLPDPDELRGGQGPVKFCVCGAQVAATGPDLCARCVEERQTRKGGEPQDLYRVRCESCSAREPGAVDVYHEPGKCQPAADETSELPKRDEPRTLLDPEQDPKGPVFYDSTGPEPSNGWTNTPVEPGDPRIGQHVDDEDFEDEPEEDPELVVHCPGAWVPPGTEPYACSPVPTDSTLVYGEVAVERASNMDAYYAKQAREQFPGIDCETCRMVMESVMKASKWLGPDGFEAPGRGWLGPVDESLLERPKANMDRALGVQLDPAAPDDIRANPSWDPTKQGEEEPEILAEQIRRDYKQCCCGHPFAAHRDRGGGCGRCPCVSFREGQEQELFSRQEEQEDKTAKRHAFVASLDMEAVRTQRVAKRYAQCQLCRKQIKGPAKDDKGKTTQLGEQWVGPKSDKTPSMNHRAHFLCADEALSLLKSAKAEA